MEERLPAKLQYALARALAERLLLSSQRESSSCRLIGGELLLWYGAKASPTLALPPLGDEELRGLSELWSAQFSDGAR